jgi:oxygen-dependent protoporphyrinogen oxidase
MTARTPRLVVVGAGITGLTAAYRAVTDHLGTDVVVLDAATRIGGKIVTTEFAGQPIDEGADAFLARVEAPHRLCEELGLADQFTSPAVARALVYTGAALHPLPANSVLGVPTDVDALAASGICSAAGVARAATDLTAPDDSPAGLADGTSDESVGSLVRRRLGDEVLERVVAPLLGGVHAGNVDQLSLAAGAPQLHAAARAAAHGDGSLMRALQSQQAAARSAPGFDPGAPVFFGLRDGTGTLLHALADALPPTSLRLATAATALVPRADGGIDVTTSAGDTIEATAVILAVPSFVAAELLAPHDHDLATSLDQLAWASVVMTALAANPGTISHPLDGSGFLVAEAEGLLLTACSFGSSKWAHWGHDDQVILRASVGRIDDTRALALSDDDLVDAVVADLGATIGLATRPADVRVSRWLRALPQYTPGHLERAATWKAAASAAVPGLALAGASYDGLGIPACVTDGTKMAGELGKLGRLAPQ